MKIKNIAVSLSFLVLIFGLSIAFFIFPDKEISISERRKLDLLPEFTAEKFINGEYFEDYENYMLDQFPLRDYFRTVKAANEYYVLRKLDNNDIYMSGGYVSKLEYPLDESCMKIANDKFIEWNQALFGGGKAYYSIIPDKNLFLAENGGYPSLDYEKLISMMNVGSDFNYIDITDSLSLDDYYKTDLHWRQERIIPVAEKLLSAMGVNGYGAEYKQNTLFPFYGSFFGQAALPLGGEELVYMTNDMLENCILKDPMTGEESGIYKTDSFGGIDSYDVFLSGARALLVLENPSAESDKTLYLLRDSFGSSIAPLLACGYSKIVLIDMRYISVTGVQRYISTDDEGDVLFLMSVPVLNNSYLYR